MLTRVPRRQANCCERVHLTSVAYSQQLGCRFAVGIAKQFTADIYEGRELVRAGEAGWNIFQPCPNLTLPGRIMVTSVARYAKG